MNSKHYLTVEELQKKMFKVLCQVADICEAQGLRYSLVGGTLLGAVRHKGFIPWDDDVDIAMPRPDYEAFSEYCQTHETPFKLSYIETGSRVHSSLNMKAYDPKTQIYDRYERYDKHIGVFVDIFSIESIGNSLDEIYRFKDSIKFKFWLLVAVQWKYYFRSFGRPWYVEPIRCLLYLVSRFYTPDYLTKEIELKYPNYKFGTTKYNMDVFGSYGDREIFPDHLAKEYGTIEFEGRMFMCFKDYELYLKQIFGDYMQLPPVDKRVSHHTFVAWDK